jgi:hypothetical protein
MPGGVGGAMLKGNPPIPINRPQESNFQGSGITSPLGLQSWVSKRGAGRKTSPAIAIRLLAIGIYQKLRAKTMASTARAGTMAPLGEGFVRVASPGGQ